MKPTPATASLAQISTALSTSQSAPRAPSVLDQVPARIPTAGRIRAGIKVLTKAAAAIAQAQSIYDQGVQEGRSFDFIEEALAKALPDLRNPLVPKNMPWFTVRGGDFSHPDLARQILESYGEDRGDGERRLYRFPVVFPSDSWQAVMPHELVAWGSSERKFWSEYSADGSQRYCKCHAAVPKDKGDKSGTRAIRIFGGRKAVLREDNGGLCEPEACPQYQARQCNLTGRFVFFIPGIRSLAAFDLPTNSFYAMNAALQTFRTIAFMRGGRISGFLDASKTPFYISKRLMEVPHIDAEGRAVRVKQWIIELEAPVDVTALLRADEDEMIGNATIARSVLDGSAVIDAEEVSGASGQKAPRCISEFSDRPSMSAPSGEHTARFGALENDYRVAQSTSADGPDERPTRPAATSAERPARPSRHSASNGSSSAGSRHDVAVSDGPSVEQVLDAAQTSGVAHPDYEAYAAKRWGSGWRLNAAGRRRALEEISALSDEPQALAEKVRAELNVFS